MPGLIALGEGKLPALIESARKESIDFLFIVNIDVKSGGGITQNSTNLGMIHVASGKPLESVPHTTKLLNTRAEKEIENGKDPVGIQVSKFFAALDEAFKPIEMPMSAAEVEPLVENLLQEKHTNVLPVLAELKYFNFKKVLSGDQFVSGCAKLIGDEKAKIVAAATQDQLLDALSAFLPKERPQGKAL